VRHLVQINMPADHSTDNTINHPPSNLTHQTPPFNQSTTEDEVRRRGVESELADESSHQQYTDEENLMIAKGQKSISDYLANDKKEKVSYQAPTQPTPSKQRKGFVTLLYR
jgi:hypothetical protein